MEREIAINLIVEQQLASDSGNEPKEITREVILKAIEEYLKNKENSK